jgi:hypothetical protein
MDVHLYNGTCARLGVKRGRRETLNFEIKSEKSPALRAGDENKTPHSLLYHSSILSSSYFEWDGGFLYIL